MKLAKEITMKKEKKPYRKPVIRSEKIIETAALACGKCPSGSPIGGGTGACASKKANIS